MSEMSGRSGKSGPVVQIRVERNKRRTRGTEIGRGCNITPVSGSKDVDKKIGVSNKEIEAITLVERVKYDESGTDLAKDRRVRYKRGVQQLDYEGVCPKGKGSRKGDRHRDSPRRIRLLAMCSRARLERGLCESCPTGREKGLSCKTTRWRRGGRLYSGKECERRRQ